MDCTEPETSSPESKIFQPYDGPPQYETSDEFEDYLQDIEAGRPIPQAHGNASDQISEPELQLEVISREKDRSTQGSDDIESMAGGRDYFQVPIPTFSNGLTTFAYQRALRNRIADSKLLRFGEYDMRKYTPTFIHDCLMLPGSLANVLCKISPSDIFHRMTPALLPGFRAQLDCETQQPCLIQSSDPTDYVQGMLVFGQGRAGRDRIHRHYRPYARRVKVHVETDVIVSIPPFSRDYVHELWRYHRRKIKAHAWLRSKVCSVHPFFCPERPHWSLEEYLAGTNEDDESLRIDPSAYGLEEDGGVSLPNNYYDNMDVPEEKTVVYAGCGNLDYERVEDGWTGW